MKENICIDLKNVGGFISQEEILALAKKSTLLLDTLNKGTGQGSDFLGWLSLPEDIVSQLDDIEKTAQQLRALSDTTVVIGIGGSYLGSKAIIEALGNSVPGNNNDHTIMFAGHNICEDYLAELLEVVDKKNYSIVVISKSGTTTEPAIAFRVLKNHLESKFGKAEAARRIVAITDEKKGALRSMATSNGYKTFVIPDNIGGRFSVLTPAGLLPVALGGFNIREIVDGAKKMESITRNNKDAVSNPALIYAATRNLL
ncbi:MAG TPA: glucose-6-phosphate isomerase, partial [Bacteroidetes bacterium]|nr:glucose-6-phosphate isomerase [Bacteroidota bacterium]